MQRKLIALVCAVISTVVIADISSMYARANATVVDEGYAGFSEYWRVGNAPDGVIALEHVIAYVTLQGNIAYGEYYNSHDGSYDYIDTIALSYQITEEAFRQFYVYPFGGDGDWGDWETGGSNDGNSGGPPGNASGSDAGNSGGSTGGQDNFGSGPGGGGGPAPQMCVQIDDDPPECVSY